jgi:hypothetical protein
MGFFREKSSIIEALRWDGSEDSFREIASWARKHHKDDETFFDCCLRKDKGEKDTYIQFRVKENTLKMNSGDWVLRRADEKSGIFLTCSDNYFKGSFERYSHERAS